MGKNRSFDQNDFTAGILNSDAVWGHLHNFSCVFQKYIFFNFRFIFSNTQNFCKMNIYLQIFLYIFTHTGHFWAILNRIGYFRPWWPIFRSTLVKVTPYIWPTGNEVLNPRFHLNLLWSWSIYLRLYNKVKR